MRAVEPSPPRLRHVEELGKSEHVNSTSASRSKVVTAFGCLAPYSVANHVIASRARSRVSAYITSRSRPSRKAGGPLPVAILDRDQLLCPVKSHADHRERAEAVVFQPDVEVHAIDPDGDAIAVAQAALLERSLFGVPVVGQPSDVRRGQTEVFGYYRLSGDVG